ncbi:hypothetical protein N7493_000959 [Penicillium malachiteum]|uniref:Uncharacterized protein n=1 Tax=Penicillium malachiteum TaxID=1324776 RepID=A0AAD6N1H1_9EURO|nr:hypothetical protein N7493_000959 [Penicillium malachiteum]
MTGRAETRTPEPPDREEHENSPPRLPRPKRSAGPPKNYAQEQELATEQSSARLQRKKKIQGKPVAQREAGAWESSAESEDPNASELLKELVKLRKEIRRRDELHREELRKAKDELQRTKEEFSAALAEVQHELQTLAETPSNATPSEPYAHNGHDEILREIQSLREEISTPAPISSPSYADLARIPPSSYPSNIRTLSTLNTTPTTYTDTLYCTIDTSKILENENQKISAGSIRAVIETEIRAMDGHTLWCYHAVIVSPQNNNRIRIMYCDEAEYQLVKKVVEAKIGTSVQVLRDELYPIKVNSVRSTIVLDENLDVLLGAVVALSEENDINIAKIMWLSSKEAVKPYGSMVEIGHKIFQCKNIQKYAKYTIEGYHHNNYNHTVPKYIPYRGPYKSYSKNYWKLYPSYHK